MPVGLGVAGGYTPSWSSLDRLVARWGLPKTSVRREHVAAMLWPSYVVGMELPGRRALFWSLDMHLYGRADAHGGAQMTYRATVVRSEPQLEFIELEAELTCRNAVLASARMRAFVRPDPPVALRAPVEALLSRSIRPGGKVGVVIGGTRGLGAAIVQGLALQGCDVLATYQRSVREAHEISSESG